MKRIQPTPIKGEYNLTLPNSPYRQDEHILFVLQTVDSRDLEAGELLSRDVMPTWNAVLKKARSTAQAINADKAVPFSYTVVNFNAYKHLTLSPQAQTDAEAYFAERVAGIAMTVRPTRIVVLGDGAFRKMFPHVTHANLKRGWVHELEYADLGKIPVVATLDFTKLLEKDGLRGNLLGLVYNHIAHAIVGYNPYKINLNVNPRYVNTKQKFDILMRKLAATKRVAVDTETRNLSVTANRIYMIQFCLEEEPDCAYVIPLDHPMTPLSPRLREYMHKKLRAFFQGRRTLYGIKTPDRLPHSHHRSRWIADPDELPELLFFNGSFDLRIIRTCLDIPFVPHYVYEIRAGEHLLNENITDLKYFGTRAGGLLYTSVYYGSDFYLTASFGKAERDTCGAVEPDDPGLLAYCSADVQHLIAIRKSQIRRASYHPYRRGFYKGTFLRHMRYVMGETEHQTSRLRQDGSKVNLAYLRHLLTDASPLVKEMQAIETELRASPELKAVNALLKASSGLNIVNILDIAQPELFSFSKPAHRKALFFDHMKFEPVDYTPKGDPKVDKEFIDQYRAGSSVVDSYADLQELDKLKGTYVRGWVKRLRTSLDGLADHHLRPDYAYMNVTTGRLASYDPSLQVIPTRGKVAPVIQEAFETKAGGLNIRFDYSAHEVRMWSVISGDMVLAEAFRIGQQLRQAYIADPTPENLAAIKKNGDLHLLNVKRFFDRIVDKNHPLRDAVKAVIFGAIYGKSAQTLGEDTKLPDIREQKSIISAEMAKPKPDQSVIDACFEKIAEIQAEDRTEFAQGILDRMFREFANGARWLESMKQTAEQDQQVYSTIGRIRHLDATLIKDQKVLGRQLRRGVNAPIQGMSSEIGTVGSRRIDRAYYLEQTVMEHMLGYEDTPRLEFNRIVHDASYFWVAYEMVIPFIHMLQHEATYGVAEEFDKNFGLKFTIEPEIEIAISAVDHQSYTWDWNIVSLADCIINSVKDASERNLLRGEPNDVLKTIFKPWRVAECRKYLNQNYPLLGVTNGIERQQQKAIKHVSAHIKGEPALAH